MLKRLLLCVLCAVPSAFAADVGVSWTNPTQNTDGSAIPASGTGSLTGTRVEYGSCSGSAFGTKAGEVNYEIPRSVVKFSHPSRSSRVVTRCAIG